MKFLTATILISLWVGSLTFAASKLAKEATTPGEVGAIPAAWPITAQLARHSATKPTLVLTMHPKCGCTTATVAELTKIISQYPGRLDVQVLVREPVDSTWERSSREDTLATFEGVTLIPDHGGAEAARFGAMTSGQIIFFDQAGHKIFAGGLTSLRGHQGPSAGADSIATYLETGSTSLAKSVVFGCGLSDPHPRADVAVKPRGPEVRQ